MFSQIFKANVMVKFIFKTSCYIPKNIVIAFQTVKRLWLKIQDVNQPFWAAVHAENILKIFKLAKSFKPLSTVLLKREKRVLISEWNGLIDSCSRI